MISNRRITCLGSPNSCFAVCSDPFPQMINSSVPKTKNYDLQLSPKENETDIFFCQTSTLRSRFQLGVVWRSGRPAHLLLQILNRCVGVWSYRTKASTYALEWLIILYIWPPPSQLHVVFVSSWSFAASADVNNMSLWEFSDDDTDL